MLTPAAPVIWDSLKGLVCLYKPAGISLKQLRAIFINKVSRDLNKLEGRPPQGYVAIEGDDITKPLTISVKPNLADHSLVVGPRYQEQDLAVSWSNYLGFNTSGVVLFGIRSGTKQAKFMRENKPMRTYRIKGMLGQVTDNFFKSGKVIQKSTWKHVNQNHMDKFLSSMQASHQRKMFELCGLDMQSQTAYDLAVQGLIRPSNSKIPVLYGIKCIEFIGPEFTLEIQCINEYEDYLMHIVHETGEKLHSTAHCTDIQCIRHSRFTIQDALLMKHWTVPYILENIENCSKIIMDHGDIVPQKSAVLI